MRDIPTFRQTILGQKWAIHVVAVFERSVRYRGTDLLSHGGVQDTLDGRVQEIADFGWEPVSATNHDSAVRAYIELFKWFRANKLLQMVIIFANVFLPSRRRGLAVTLQ